MTFGRHHSLQSPRRGIAVGLLTTAALVVIWLFFAPSQVGGAATYSITEGISMQPMLHKNDLALVRAQSSYKVGDVVLYKSGLLHRPVLHRIIVIQNGHYFFKGDNNGFVDPGYATRSELVGKLWFHVQTVGGILGWIGKPLHAALLAILTTMFLFLGGVTGRRRRRRSRGPAKAAPQSGARPPRYSMPVTRAALSSLAVLVALGLVLVGIGFGTPSTRSVERQGAFQQTGTFSYSARAIRRSGTYPSGYAVTGQPLFASLFDTATTRFRYRFVSKLSHHVHGTIEFKAMLLAQSSGWQNLATVKAKEPFTGDTAQTNGFLVVKTLYALLNEVSAAAGTPGAQYSIVLQPIVHVSGTVDGKPIDSTFSPTLPISVTPSVVRLDVAPAVIPPGATYTPQTGLDALASALNPVQLGSIPHRAQNLVTIARYEVPVLVIRVLGLLALALALLAAMIHRRLVGRDSQRSEEEQIAAHLGCLVAPVDHLAPAEGSVPTPMRDFKSLAMLAQYLERPILQQTDDTGTTYAVDDETRIYQYHAAPVEQKLPQAASPARAVKRHTPLGRPSRLTITAATLALVIAITLVTSFTATTTVPTSNAGTSNQARQLSQLTPAGCGSLPLTNLVIQHGDFTNAASNALVLGDAATQTITDTGNHNCIVGGGGQDIVKGDTTDICVIGPTAGTSYRKCSTSA